MRFINSYDWNVSFGAESVRNNPFVAELMSIKSIGEFAFVVRVGEIDGEPVIVIIRKNLVARIIYTKKPP